MTNHDATIALFQNELAQVEILLNAARADVKGLNIEVERIKNAIRDTKNERRIAAVQAKLDALTHKQRTATDNGQNVLPFEAAA